MNLILGIFSLKHYWLLSFFILLFDGSQNRCSGKDRKKIFLFFRMQGCGFDIVRSKFMPLRHPILDLFFSQKRLVHRNVFTVSWSQCDLESRWDDDIRATGSKLHWLVREQVLESDAKCSVVRLQLQLNCLFIIAVGFVLVVRLNTVHGLKLIRIWSWLYVLVVTILNFLFFILLKQVLRDDIGIRLFELDSFVH